MPNFIFKNRRHKDWPAIWWNVHRVGLLFVFLQEISWDALPKKILNNFKHLMA